MWKLLAAGVAGFLGWEAWKKHKLAVGPSAGFAMVPGHINAFTFGYSGAGTGGALSVNQVQQVFDLNHPGLFDVVATNTYPTTKQIMVSAVYTAPAAASYTAPSFTGNWPTAFGTVLAQSVQDQGGAPQIQAPAVPATS